MWSLFDVGPHPASAAATATPAVTTTAASAGAAGDPIRFGRRLVMDTEIPFEPVDVIVFQHDAPEMLELHL